VRTCIVSVRDTDGLTHIVTLQGATLYEVAAAAIDSFRQQDWAATALTPNAVLRVEVRVPPVVHEVPLRAIERWRNAPSTSPKESLAKGRRSSG
jgi:hypothetical protein